MMRLFFVLAILLLIPASDALARPADSFLQHGAPRLSKVDKVELPGFASLVDRLSPSVVHIAVKVDEKDEQPKEGEPEFFRRAPGYKSLGSGFIVTADGYIVTNHHVIKEADQVVVHLLDDKTDHKASVIGADSKTDLALLKIETNQQLQPVFVGDSDSINVGDWVIAIGNQFQLGQTVTAGIVSAKARRVPSRAAGPYDQYIQTDASINPGSSGGPLFNTLGQVIGINSAIFTPGRLGLSGSGFNIGIGFAIPVNLAAGVLLQLRQEGKVTRGVLGVMIQPVTKDVAQVLGLNKDEGALVSDIIPGKPAALAGFNLKDVIVGFDGKKVRDFNDLPLMVAETEVGKKVVIDVIRKKKKVSLSAVIAELKEEAPKPETTKKTKVNRLGMVVSDISPKLAVALKRESTDGVLVEDIKKGSLAEGAGFLLGDVIEEVAEERVKNSEQFNKIVKKLESGQVLMVLVRRPVGTRFLTLKPE